MSKDNISTAVIAFCVAVVRVITASLIKACQSMLHPHGEDKDTMSVRTDTIYKTDTLRITEPVAKTDTLLRYITLRVPVVVKDTAESNAVGYATMVDCVDRSADPYDFTDYAIVERDGDSISVHLPIRQHVYVDSSYTAWVSGYRARLDSIEVYQRTKTITNTVTLRERRKPWSVGVQGGYGMSGNGLTPYIGIGLQYNLLEF